MPPRKGKPRFWHQLSLASREALNAEPDWILLWISRVRLDTVVRVPKRGQLPSREQSKDARIRNADLRAEGVSFKRRIEILSHRYGRHPRTIRSWIRHIDTETTGDEDERDPQSNH